VPPVPARRFHLISGKHSLVTLDSTGMSEVTRLLEAAAFGDRKASAEVLPLVYEELRRLAASRMANEAPNHTLDATALVHEAYLRLVGTVDEAKWDNRNHFFAAAAEAMRRILVDHARCRNRLRRGGDFQRVELTEDLAAHSHVDEADLLAVDEVIDRLAEHDLPVAELVKLHVFAGFTLEQTAEVLGINVRTAYRNWSYARAWMFQRLGGEPLPKK
jgi:RNA polymerase sigma factor (TIGR02999 family)